MRHPRSPSRMCQSSLLYTEHVRICRGQCTELPTGPAASQQSSHLSEEAVAPWTRLTRRRRSASTSASWVSAWKKPSLGISPGYAVTALFISASLDAYTWRYR